MRRELRSSHEENERKICGNARKFFVGRKLAKSTKKRKETFAGKQGKFFVERAQRSFYEEKERNFRKKAEEILRGTRVSKFLRRKWK